MNTAFMGVVAHHMMIINAYTRHIENKDIQSAIHAIEKSYCNGDSESVITHYVKQLREIVVNDGQLLMTVVELKVLLHSIDLLMCAHVMF